MYLKAIFSLGRPGMTPGRRGLIKMLIVMKLTAIILLAGLLQVSARGYSQKVSLSLKNSHLEKAFREIEKQTGYSFIYGKKQLEQARSISVVVKDEQLEDVLSLVFKDQPLTYTISGIYIAVKQKDTKVIAGFVPPPPPDISVEGKVVNEKGEGLVGASVGIKGTSLMISVGTDGAFSIQLPGPRAVLIVSHVGYKTKEVVVTGPEANPVIVLEVIVAGLTDVEVVSTGYQAFSRERAPGSFDKINNQLFNRTTGPSVVARLDGITTGLLFNKTQSWLPDVNFMTIRGLSTLESNKTPLIVLDNFPYEGDINNINPNDVESVTILKDAAAASIWGVRAGNGVIVITTKKGGFDRPLQVSVNANIISAQKPDLFYLPQMSTSDYISVEKYLFAQNNYDYLINDNFTHPLLSPVVDLLARQRAGTISAATANAQIDALGKYDVRNDFLKYVYRNSVNRQYAVNLSGGTRMLNYFLSAGYDKGTGNMVRTGNDRITFRSDLTFKPLLNLEIEAGTQFTQTTSQSLGGDLLGQLLYSPSKIPYLRLVDDLGNPAVAGRNYRASFVDNPGDSRLLDWHFNPLAELDASSNTSRNYDWLINIGATYKLSKIFSASLKYQYERTISEQKDVEGLGSYYTRNLINLYTQPAGSPVVKPIPAGDILNQSMGDFYSHTARGQLNADKTWKGKHQLTAIAGVEVRENHSTSNSYNTYGYSDRNLAYQPVNYTTNYAFYLPVGSGTIPNNLSYFDHVYRFTSLYSNAAYTYDNRYTLSASVRKDASNLFGVNSNQRGVPLWSAGAGWNISRESFYKSALLPLLKFRATYGYNGNTNNNLSAYSVLAYTSPSSYTGLPNAVIKNPANADLRWEKVGVLNFGLDFGFKNNRLSGSIEYFKKYSKDLLYLVPTGLSTGFNFNTVNGVTMEGRGVDLALHSINFKGRFTWSTDFNFSYNANKITRFTPLNAPSAGEYLGASNLITPIVGQPLYAVYAYKWAGLDPLTGAPQGYINKQVSKDYATLISVPADSLQYFGSAVPVYFGSFCNTITWKKISLSANIVYKLDYYFKRAGINYGQLFYGGYGHSDYAKRWQKPGDEKNTNVPSMVYPDDYYSDMFYQNSAPLISKGDHIRLQDIVMSYNIDKVSHYFKNVKVYANVSNLGILWRANKEGVDPDYGAGFPVPVTFAFGVNANF